MITNVFKTEKIVGIECYATKAEGIGGRIRKLVEDFNVVEIPDDIGRKYVDDGKYLIVEITKTSWDTHNLVRDMSRHLRVSSSRIGWAGTKDKRAVTTQLMSLWDTSESDLEKINLRGIEMSVVGRSNSKIALGDLVGNRFTIIIRDIALSLDEVEKRLADITGQTEKIGGFVNFFGIQRFGSRRPVTHEVGKLLLEGDFKEAAYTYIAKAYKDEKEEARVVRTAIWESRDVAQGIETYPFNLRFERAMLHHLGKCPDDYVGAFKALSPNLQKMFIHAFQSYMFNRILSARIMEGIPLDEAIVGDVVCFRNKQGLPNAKKVQKVTEKDLKAVNRLISKGRAWVTAPILGYESEYSGGRMGEIERQIVEESGIELSAFKMEGFPEISSKGLRREILIGEMPVFEVAEDELHEGKAKVNASFSLPKGCYATTVLREYMKGNPLDMS